MPITATMMIFSSKVVDKHALKGAVLDFHDSANTLEVTGLAAGGHGTRGESQQHNTKAGLVSARKKRLLLTISSRLSQVTVPLRGCCAEVAS